MRKSWLEHLGIVFVFLFLSGLALTLVAIAIYLWKSNQSPDPFLPLLMLLPFAVQLIYLRLWQRSKEEESLITFFNTYNWVMCPALFFYSLFFFIYELLAFFSPEGYWSKAAIVIGLYGAPAAVVLLVWAIGNCTRIIIRSGLGSDRIFLEDRNLEQPANEALRNRLDVIDKAHDLLNKDNRDLLKVFANTRSDEYDNLQNILAAFQRKGIAQHQLVPALTEIRGQQLALKALADLLKDDAEIHEKVNSNGFKSIHRKDMIKALNRLIVEGKFQSSFSSAKIDLGSDKKTARDTNRSIHRKNRRLLDKQILLHLSDKHEAYSLPTTGKFEWLLAVPKMWCDEHRDQKIFEGIQRFPFEMLTFFFTIFVLVGYLFAFSFAFHDKHTLQETGTPALHAPSLQAPPSFSSLLTQTRARQSKQPSFFFYYDPASAGLITTKEATTDNTRTTDSKRSNRDKVATYSKNIQEELRLENASELNDLVDLIRTETTSDNKVYVEIVGRANDEPVNFSGGAKQVYASNYELSAARAQNLKLELLQQLRDSAGSSLEIDWFCLPVSNDPSIGGRHPLANPDNSESVIVRSSTDSSGAINGVENLVISVDKISKVPPASPDKQNDERVWLEKQRSYLVDLSEKISDLATRKQIPQDGASDIAMTLETALTVYKNERRKDFEEYKQEFETLKKRIEGAVRYYFAGAEKANRRIVEVYVTVIKKDSSFFTPNEINKPQDLADKLFSNGDESPLSGYLRDRLPQTKRLFENKNIGNASGADALRRSLSDELNRTLEDPYLYNEQRFANVALSPGTRSLLNANPKGKELTKLNRLLLAETYSDELVKTPQNSASSAQLSPLDYVYFGMYTITTTGYGDIRPTTLYARFLCTMANIVAIFFLVVFFNALLSISNVRSTRMDF